jgi:hypothetical protein
VNGLHGKSNSTYQFACGFSDVGVRIDPHFAGERRVHRFETGLRIHDGYSQRRRASAGNEQLFEVISFLDPGRMAVSGLA